MTTDDSGPRQALSRRLRALYTASVYDVMWDMGIAGQCLDVGIKPLARDMVVAGPAYTIIGGVEPRSTKREYERPNVRDFAMLEAIPGGHVVVLQTNGESRTGHWGELLSTAAQSKGALGVVIDGGTRDAPLLRAMTDWPVFCRYTSPVESDGTWRVYDFGIPISMSGTLSARVRVDPGDWIFGDEDGVLVIPAGHVEDVVAEAEKIKTTEDKVRAELRAGASFKEVYERYERF
ncbi:RraA family protein [Dactylosporangium sp. CA-092794]|uniref:RraA family protein n=1 Tax=Dactylosporangium sp. CA-092794 TaxID=3239929 RepID=UPI003D8B60BA